MVCLIEDSQFLSLGVYSRRHLAHSTLAFTHPRQEKEGGTQEVRHTYRKEEREGKNGKEGSEETRGENKKLRRELQMVNNVDEGHWRKHLFTVLLRAGGTAVRARYRLSSDWSRVGLK